MPSRAVNFAPYPGQDQPQEDAYSPRQLQQQSLQHPGESMQRFLPGEIVSGMGPPAADASLGRRGVSSSRAATGGPEDEPQSGKGMPAPMLRFRSDNAYMTAKEMENRQRKAQELQDALDQQILEKKRKKVGNELFSI